MSMIWHQDNQSTEYKHYNGLILVVYHTVNYLYTWHVERKDMRGMRIMIECGQKLGRNRCKEMLRNALTGA